MSLLHLLGTYIPEPLAKTVPSTGRKIDIIYRHGVDEDGVGQGMITSKTIHCSSEKEFVMLTALVECLSTCTDTESCGFDIGAFIETCEVFGYPKPARTFNTNVFLETDMDDPDGDTLAEIILVVCRIEEDWTVTGYSPTLEFIEYYSDCAD